MTRQPVAHGVYAWAAAESRAVLDGEDRDT